jgi:hypothetical protein
LQDGRCAAEEVHILSQLLLLAPKKKEKFIRERVGVKGALLYTWNYPRKERGEISTCYPSIYRLHSKVYTYSEGIEQQRRRNTLETKYSIRR